jgi:phytoene dehydrogenase-like protein
MVNDKGEVEGVMLESGKTLKSNMVLSNVTPKVTFLDMMEGHELPKEYLNSIKNVDYTSPVTKINVAVNKLPNFLANPNVNENEVMPHHRCTIHLNCESTEILEDAYSEAATNSGTYSSKPMIELTIPSR